MRFLPLLLLPLAALVGCADTRAPQQSAPREERTGAIETPDVDADFVAVADPIHDDILVTTPVNDTPSQRDVDLAKAIHDRIGDAKISMLAEKITVAAHDGKVSLRGTVSSADERKRIEDIATSLAGAGNVDDHLEIENQTSYE